MKNIYIIISLAFIWTCSSSSSKPTEPTVPTQPPTVNNLTLTTNEDTPTTFTMTGTDPGNFALTFSIATQPQHGTLTTSGSSGTYTPKSNYNGEDTFGFIATNGTLTSTAGIATITIAPVDDNPNTMNVSAITDEDNAVEITLEAEEYDGDTISFNIKDNPTSGSVSLTGDKATYTPNENYFGADSFTFEAVDTTAKKILNTATASITINPINDAPAVEDMQEVEGVEDTELTITLTGTDIDGDNLSYEVDTAPTQGTITENGTTFTYTPNQDFYGADSLTYKAYDGTEYSEAKKIPLFINRGPRDWPYIFSYGQMSRIGNPTVWEGKMYDYNKDGYPDFLSSGNDPNDIDNDGITNEWLLRVFDYQFNIYHEIDFGDIAPPCTDNSGCRGNLSSMYYPEGADLNGDGIDDFIESMHVEDPSQGYYKGATFVALSRNNSMFEHEIVEIDNDGQVFWPGGLRAIDFDKDGDIDIYGQNGDISEGYGFWVYYNDGQGNFTKSFISTNMVDHQYLRNQNHIDLNGDGYRDIVGLSGHPDQKANISVLWGTSDYTQYNAERVWTDFTIYEPQDLAFADIDKDGYYEIFASYQQSNGGYGPDQKWATTLVEFKWNGSNYEINQNSIFNHERLIQNQASLVYHTAWDYDQDGDEDIFFQIYNNKWNYGDGDGEDSCYAWHEDLVAEANGEIVHGFYFHNDNGTLIKTNLSQKEDECDVDLGFDQESFD